MFHRPLLSSVGSQPVFDELCSSAAPQGRTEGDSTGVESGCKGSRPAPSLHSVQSPGTPSAASSSVSRGSGSGLAVRIKGHT